MPVGLERVVRDGQSEGANARLRGHYEVNDRNSKKCEILNCEPRSWSTCEFLKCWLQPVHDVIPKTKGESACGGQAEHRRGKVMDGKATCDIHFKEGCEFKDCREAFKGWGFLLKSILCEKSS